MNIIHLKYYIYLQVNKEDLLSLSLGLSGACPSIPPSAFNLWFVIIVFAAMMDFNIVTSHEYTMKFPLCCFNKTQYKIKQERKKIIKKLHKKSPKTHLFFHHAKIFFLFIIL